MAAGALVVGVAAPAAAVGPGDLGDDISEDWDLVVGAPGGVQLNVLNNSGWSEEGGIGYAVLDPALQNPPGLGVVSLQTRKYDERPLTEIGPGLEISTISATVRTTDAPGTSGPAINLRLADVDVVGECSISFEMPRSEGWQTFDAFAEPAPAGGGWDDFGRCGLTIDGGTWDEIKGMLPGARIAGISPWIGGVSISNGSTSGGEFAMAHIDEFTFGADVNNFEAPILEMEGTATPPTIEAGASTEVTVSATLSGPNQATIENIANFITGAGGLTSAGTLAVTSESYEGLCTLEPTDADLTFDPKRGLFTRPVGAPFDITADEIQRPQLDNGLLAELDPPVDPEIAVEATVTVTASTANAGGVGVSPGGTCTIGLVPPEGVSANAALLGEVVVSVNPAVDTRPAPALPDEVPADAGALTVEPACLVEGDMITVAAPAGSFSPDSVVSVGLYDSGIDVGEFTAEPDGSLSIEGPLPNGVPDGPQEVLTVGYASVENDELTYLSAEFEVGCATGGGGSGGVPSGIPAGDGGTDDGNGLLGIGAAGLLAAAGYLGLRMRRMFSA